MRPLVRDDFTVRIGASPVKDGALEEGSAGRWIGRLRHIGTAKLRACGLAELADDAELLISELVTNALQHGRRNGEIEFRLVITHRELLIAVNDGSPTRPHPHIADTDSESGRGLLIVAAYAHTWGVTPDGTTTWCTLNHGKTSR